MKIKHFRKRRIAPPPPPGFESPRSRGSIKRRIGSPRGGNRGKVDDQDLGITVQLFQLISGWFCWYEYGNCLPTLSYVYANVLSV